MMDRRIKIVADPLIPFLQGVLEPYADVEYVDGVNICSENIKDADALLIRLRTICDETLLGGSAVSLIATTAVGTDHIDFEYCKANDIEVYSAMGSTANGVMQYVFSALYGVASRKAIKMDGYVFGIIGAGKIGCTVARVAKYLGFKVLICDSIRVPEEFKENEVTLDELLSSSNIVSVHTSLRDATRGFINKHFFSKMKPGAFFINACRGEFVDEAALMEAIPMLGGVILDSWQHEPHINKELLEMVDIGTPHISGYSLNTKMKGTSSVVRSVAEKFGIEDLMDFYPKTEIPVEPVGLDLKGKTQGEIASIFQYNYPIFTDDFFFRIAPDDFDRIRDEYNARKEIYIVDLDK